MMTGLSGTFKIGWFVQRNIYMFSVKPRLPEYLEHESVGLDSGVAIGNRLVGDAHFTCADQCTAPLARTKTLRLQDTV
jgi:hypothetical protein